MSAAHKGWTAEKYLGKYFSRPFKMIDNLDFKVKLFSSAAPFFIGLTGLAMDIHIACTRHYKIMTSALQRSPCLSYATTLWGETSLRSRVLVISMIAGTLTSPKFCIRRGSLDAQDYRAFPHRLKKRLIISSQLNVAACIWLTFNHFFM